MAEIHSKIIGCSGCGKYFDVANLRSCPYCGTPANSFSETIDPDSGASQSQMSKTITPYDEGQNVVIIGKFPDTEPPRDDTKDTKDSGKFPKTEDLSLWDDDETDDGSAQAGNGIVPVVGWMIILTGAYKGSDFKVHAGYNDIGRETGDIIIPGDNTISREKDANITYVPQTNRFYIAHVQGKSVLTVNDAPVVGGTVELNPYDVITIGNTKFVFIPLCGPRFNWKDGVSDA